MWVKLNDTNNPSVKPYIGEIGEIQRNEHNGYTFKMRNGLTVTTSAVDTKAPSLGDINNNLTQSLYFQTKSGSIYDFENIERRERAVDGVFKQDNQFLGFDKEEREI